MLLACLRMIDRESVVLILENNGWCSCKGTIKPNSEGMYTRLTQGCLTLTSVTCCMRQLTVVGAVLCFED